MIRAHVIRLYPNVKQRELLAKTAGVARYCYNWGLQKWNEAIESGEQCDQYSLSRTWTKEKPDWARSVSATPQIRAFLNLGRAFCAFFRHQSHRPKFHKRGVRDSFYLDSHHARIVGSKRLRIAKVGVVRMAEDLRFSGKVLGYTVSHKADSWFVCITVELEDPQPPVVLNSAVGIDVGSKHWAVTSDSDVLYPLSTLKHNESRLKHYQRVLSRRVKGSNNYAKAKLKASMRYKRISDVKSDYIHKFTSHLVKNHDLVCCESLSVQGMRRAHRSIRVAVHNSCMSEIRKQLRYKAKRYIEINRFFPSSKMCSCCGNIKTDLRLRDRTYYCSECGLSIDRDLNAALNIRREGLRVYTEGHSESACGGCGCADAVASAWSTR